MLPTYTRSRYPKLRESLLHQAKLLGREARSCGMDSILLESDLLAPSLTMLKVYRMLPARSFLCARFPCRPSCAHAPSTPAVRMCHQLACSPSSSMPPCAMFMMSHHDRPCS